MDFFTLGDIMKYKTPSEIAQDGDFLVPDVVVAQEFHITQMTLSRWDADARLGFPPAIKIRTRKYRSRNALNEFKRRMIERATSSASKKEKPRGAAAANVERRRRQSRQQSLPGI
jgi:hypothetical protein